MLREAAFDIFGDSDVTLAGLLAPQDVDVTHVENMVGLERFELSTSSTRTRRSTKLSHSPKTFRIS